MDICRRIDIEVAATFRAGLPPGWRDHPVLDRFTDLTSAYRFGPPVADVVVAGLGDSGVLTAIHLARHADVVGISSKPGLVSGQELGMRVSRPDDWARDYFIVFRRFRGLDPVRIVHGGLTGMY